MPAKHTHAPSAQAKSNKRRIDWFTVVVLAVLIVGGIGAWAMARLLIAAVEVIAS